MIAIDVEMPNSCAKCQFQIEKDGCFRCRNKVIGSNKRWNERLSDCPLKEIVTCKDCKYYRNKDNDEWCTNHSIKDNKFWVREDYFCADGERRE